MKWRRTFIEKCYQFVRLSKKDVKNPARNLDNRARQLVAFCSRIKPIHLILWQILLNRIPKPNPKGPPTGVSTYCHLEGVPYKDAWTLSHWLDLLCLYLSVDLQWRNYCGDNEKSINQVDG